MCGFVFAFAPDADRLPDHDRLVRMERAIRHRGPDEHDQARAGRAAMAHGRLAIIDLGGGRQPMCTPDRRTWIVYNGEIYNFHELRDDLIAAGHVFTTHSDTEVLLHAWLEWGARCVDRLNGMFAFAIYDARDHSMFAARDRFGEKPLYVTERDGVLYLASELKALVEGGLVEKRLDGTALYNYFANGYIMGPRTIFRGVRRLQPGHWLKADSAGVRERAYWRPPEPMDEFHDEDEILRVLRELLPDAVDRRLVAEVPLGFFLSGGVDSSAVVALASQVRSERLETFSIGFKERRHDERQYARYVAQRFGTRHHEFVLEPAGLEVIEQIAWHADEPFADAAALPTWHLSKLARQHVTVALSGDGGDEMFAGYDCYRGHLLSERLRRVPAVVRAATSAAVRSLPARDPGKRMARLRLARNIDDASLQAADRFVAKQQFVLRRAQLGRISPYLASYATAATDRALFAPMYEHAKAPLAGMALWQQTVSLPDDMLVKVDRMSMAHSLEVRAPFLDHRIAELMNRVSMGVKMPGGRQKHLLRKAVEPYLPASFLARRKKGFEVPLADWFKDDLNGYIHDRLLVPNSMTSNLFQREALQRMVGEHARLRRDWSTALWAMLMFETWCERYGIGAEALDFVSPEDVDQSTAGGVLLPRHVPAASSAPSPSSRFRRAKTGTHQPF